MPPGSGVVAACRAADARPGDGSGRSPPATAAGIVVRLGRGVARAEEGADAGEDGTGTDDGAAAKGAATREAGAPGTAPPGPPGTTASVITTPAAMSTAPATAAPDRKLTSSIRA